MHVKSKSDADFFYRSHAEARTVRMEACRLAALVMAGRPEDSPSPLVWSLAVFFESYITKGSEHTLREFGPKRPVKLRSVKR